MGGTRKKGVHVSLLIKNKNINMANSPFLNES